MSTKTSIAIVIVVILAVILAFFVARNLGAPAASPSETSSASTSAASLANPASVNCVQSLHGQLEIVDGSGGAVGYCHLPDGRVCEEWSLMRGGCDAPSSSSSTLLQNAKQSAIGSWRSTDDSSYTLEINPDGTAIERYAGDSAATATGTWQIFTSADPDPNYQGTLTPGTIYAKVDTGGVSRYFSILTLSTSTLRLMYLDRGNTLSFTKTSQ